jgi:hypothetical protein
MDAVEAVLLLPRDVVVVWSAVVVASSLQRKQIFFATGSDS